MLRNEIIAVRKRHTDIIRPLPRGRCVISAPLAEGATVHDERELRDFCCRIFGWDDARQDLVDEVTQSLLDAVARGAAIGLRGESDLVPVAHALHRRLLGPERPFIVCDPRRGDGPGSVRSPPNCRSGMDALMSAAGGSICIRSRRLPADFDAVSEALRGSGPTAQVFICLSGRDRVRDMLSPPVEIPSLRRRETDLERVIGEYLADATRALGVGRMRFPGIAPDSILHGVTSFSELERTLLRLVALKSARNMSQAASRLRVAPVSLSRWIQRRRPTAVFRDVARLEYEDGPEARHGADAAGGDPLTVEMIMPRHRRARARASKETTALVVATGGCSSLVDAFDLLRLDVIGLEALASAANAAIDEYRLPPSADRREFHRVHSLVSDTREKAVALVELAENLKQTFMPRGEAANSDP